MSSLFFSPLPDSPPKGNVCKLMKCLRQTRQESLVLLGPQDSAEGGKAIIIRHRTHAETARPVNQRTALLPNSITNIEARKKVVEGGEGRAGQGRVWGGQPVGLNLHREA